MIAPQTSALSSIWCVSKVQLQVAVGFEALPAEASALLVRVDNFRDACISLRLRRQTKRQIEQQVRRRQRCGFHGKMNRRRGVDGICIEANLMRYEGALVEGPQQLVQRLRLGRVSLRMTICRSRK